MHSLLSLSPPQRLALTGYLPCVYFGLRDGAFDWRVGNPDNWFERLPWAPKVCPLTPHPPPRSESSPSAEGATDVGPSS